jgi:hypothetical protein
VRESLLCGSIPILGNDYVFSERDGIHVTGSTGPAGSAAEEATYKRAASVVIGSLKREPAYLEKIREKLKKSKTIVSWDEISKAWPV